MKLQLKILLPIISLIVILMAVSSVITYNISSSSLHGAIIQNMGDEANNIERSIDGIMKDAVANMERTAELQSITNFYQGDVYAKENVAAIQTVLKRLEESFVQFNFITLADAKGKLVATNEPGMLGRDFASRPYMVQALGGKTFLSAPYKSPVTGAAMVWLRRRYILTAK